MADPFDALLQKYGVAPEAATGLETAEDQLDALLRKYGVNADFGLQDRSTETALP